MVTLNAHNHFVTLSRLHYQIDLEFPRESTTVLPRNRPLNNQDRIINKTQEAPEAMFESGIEERKLYKSHSSGPAYDLSSRHRGQVQLNSQPLKSNCYTIDLENTVAASSAVKADEFTEREYFMRCVMLGSTNTGKHSLIANISEEPKQHQNKTGVDLVMKESMCFKTTKKYHFWIRTLGDTSETKDAVWKTYYKFASAFMFVYDITNRDSFESLEKTVKSVLHVVPQNKFFGILVGNKTDLSKQRTVEYSEAMDFKRKYNLNHFIETNSFIEKQTPQIMPRLDSKLKLVFESI
jgi:small GTP-binding protein